MVVTGVGVTAEIMKLQRKMCTAVHYILERGRAEMDVKGHRPVNKVNMKRKIVFCEKRRE